MNSSRAKPTEEQWLRYKDLIRRWYLVEEMHLDEILTQLSHRSFTVTKNQLHYMMNKKWKIRKNIDENTWIQIDHHINKRKRQGKESEVIYCGKRLKPDTVKKETDRFRNVGIFAQLASKQSSLPELPDDTLISICTPPLLSAEESNWPRIIPWLQFPAKHLRTMIDTYMVKSQINEPLRLEAIIPLPCYGNGQLSTSITQLSVSRLAGIIGMSMPESYPDEQLQRTQLLLNGSREEKLYEYLCLVMYPLSNNLHGLYEDEEWQATVAILKMSGLLETKVYPKGLKSLTIDAFMENLFQMAIERVSSPWIKDGDSMAIVKWLLFLGQKPHLATIKAIRSTFESKCSLGMQLRLLELAEHLLKTGNSVILISGRPVLEIVLDPLSSWDSATVFRMTKLLLEHGAFIHLHKSLHLAIQRWNTEMIDMIISYGADLTAEVESDSKFVYRATALSVAAHQGLAETQYILDLLASRTPQKPIKEYITPDVLISAAAVGQCDTLRLLCDIHRTPVANYYGITPLHAAAYKGCLHICEILLPLYGTYASLIKPPFSPLHAACRNHHLHVVQFLIAQGADVHASLSSDNTAEGYIAAASLFQVAWYSDYNWHLLLRDHPVTPLDIIFQYGSRQAPPKIIASCAIMLIKAGAKPSGHEVNFAIQWLHRDLLSLGLATGVKPEPSALLLALMYANRASTTQDLHDIVKLLLQSGATFDGGELALAIPLGDQTLVDLLLQYGVSFLGGEIAEAIHYRDRHLVNLLLRSGAPLIGGEITAALRIEDYDLCCLLPTSGAPISRSDVDKAVYLRNYKLVDLLLKFGAPLSATHLTAAARIGSFDIVNLLLEYGGPLQGHELALAMQMKNCKLVDLLLRYSGSPLKTDSFGATPLEIAIQSNYESGLMRLFKAIPNSYDAGSLCAAIATRRNSIVRKLVLNRCSKPASHAMEVTAVALAADSGDLGLLRSLLEHPSPYKCGPLPLAFHAGGWVVRREYHSHDVRSFPWGSPLALLALNTEQGNSEMDACSELLNNGFLPDRLTWVAAASAGNLACIQFLLDRDVKYDNTGNDNIFDRLEPYAFSALQLAAKLGDFDIIQCLVEAGADINCPPTVMFDATALQFAAINGQLAVAKYLLDHGADVNAPPAEINGRTALEGAAEWGRLDMLALLLANGAEKAGKDTQRSFVRAVKRATEEGHHTAANFLKQSLGWSEEDESLFQSDMLCIHSITKDTCSIERLYTGWPLTILRHNGNSDDVQRPNS